MNELATLSDTELDKAIEKVKERELALQTESGQRFIISKMREIIMYLEKLGYKIEGDELTLARLWANAMGDEYVRIGEEGMKKAVMLWAEEDASEYRSFPKIPWIKEACSKVGGDPRVEKGRRVQAEAERKMEEDHKREMEEFKKNHPDLWERAERLKEGTHNVSDILG